MSYDPFARGPHPVGVLTGEPVDATRDRVVPLELWYPASDDRQGADLDPERQDRYRVIPSAPEVPQSAVRDAEAKAGPFPLVMFSHCFGGHRRQTTHLCTHLASHGYVVGSIDHLGNTISDIMQMASSIAEGSLEVPIDTIGMVKTIMDDRPTDVRFAIDHLQAGAPGLPASLLDHDCGVGMIGHSLGGWTTLRVARDDRRIRAALPLAPAGGRVALGSGAALLEAALDLDWDRDLPILYLVAERDSLLPLDGIRGLFARTPGSKQMVVLSESDHLHFFDRVEETHEKFRLLGGMLIGGLAAGISDGPDFAELLRGVRAAQDLCPGEHAYALLQGLGLAHMDAHLKGDARAADLLSGDLVALLAARGVAITL